MMEDNLNSGEETKPRPPLTMVQKGTLYAVGVLILMGAAFFAGRYSALMKPAASNPFTQMPTPQPLGTPIPVPESVLTMINFTGVSEAKKAEVLAKFNGEYCQCNCKMTVATCMVRDPGCPFWKDHVTQFQKALGNGKKPNLTQAPMPSRILPPSNGLVLPPGNSNGFTMPSQTGK